MVLSGVTGPLKIVSFLYGVNLRKLNFDLGEGILGFSGSGITKVLIFSQCFFFSTLIFQDWGGGFRSF